MPKLTWTWWIFLTVMCELCWRLSLWSQTWSKQTTTRGKAKGSWVPAASHWSETRDSCHQGLAGGLVSFPFHWFLLSSHGVCAPLSYSTEKYNTQFPQRPWKYIKSGDGGKYALPDNTNWALIKWLALFSLPSVDTIVIQVSHWWGNWDTDEVACSRSHT